MLVTDNMDETISFYQSVLGFVPPFTLRLPPSWNAMVKPSISRTPLEVMKCFRGHAEIYIEVRGIERLWEHLRGFKTRYRICDLFNRDYGMTEFHIEDRNGCLVFVGEPTPRE